MIFMNRQEIIKTLKESDLNLKELWFGFGGGLVMHGLKENTKDIDAQVTSKYFQELIDKGYLVKSEHIDYEDYYLFYEKPSQKS